MTDVRPLSEFLPFSEKFEQDFGNCNNCGDVVKIRLPNLHCFESQVNCSQLKNLHVRKMYFCEIMYIDALEILQGVSFMREYQTTKF